MDEQILVIDDELEVLSCVLEMLQVEGFEPEGVSDSVEAAQLIKERQFDLILSDISMPNFTGLQLLALVKERSPATEVIIFTGYDTPSWVEEALRHQAFAFIKKPFSLDDLMERVKQALWKRRVTKGKAGRHPPLP
jgi:DNA-binding NtrC family response regulator